MDFIIETKVIRTFEIINKPDKNKNSEIIKNNKNNKNKEIKTKENNINNDDILNVNCNKLDNKIDTNQINETKRINYSDFYNKRLRRLFKKINEIKSNNLNEEYQNDLRKWYRSNRKNINTLFANLIKTYYNLGIRFNDHENNIYDCFIDFLFQKTLY
tara:strand:- start:4140 stop:4613 length:474 start_codon:yes stop_codon:yes gene_type:complete